jgi:hypothetical protein
VALSNPAHQPPNIAMERTVDYRGRTLVANRLLAGSACGRRQSGRLLNSVVKHLQRKPWATF